MFPGKFIIIILRFFILIFLWVLSDPAQAQNIFPDTLRSCKVDSLMLDAGFGYDKYEWSTGDTTQIIWVSITGQYVLEFTKDDLTKKDSVFVVIVDAFIQELAGPVLCGDTIYLYPSSQAFDFTWMPMNIISDSIAVYPRDTAWYYANIQDTLLGLNHCYDSVRVDVSEIIKADSIVQFKMGCPDSTAAHVQAFISGGFPPYNYEWSEGQPYFSDPSKAWKLANGQKKLIVTDSLGCKLKHTFEVKAYPLPEIELTSDPTDTVYIQKPFVHFTYENISYDSLGTDTFYLNSLWWDFLGTDSIFVYDIESPDYTYSNTGTYEVYFHYRTFYGCQDSNNVHIQITVEPVELRATSVITPNDDDFNRYFQIFEEDATQGGNNNGGNGLKSISSGTTPIDLSKYFLSNTLVIFNRYGQKVYETDNYQNDWEAKGIKDGVYFYILNCKGYYEDKTYKGSIMILTSLP